MNEEEVKGIIEQSLKKVAPEINFLDIDLNRPFRTQVDIDSYDLYNMLAQVEAKTHIRIPETQIREIKTLSGLIKYIADPNHKGQSPRPQ